MKEAFEANTDLKAAEANLQAASAALDIARDAFLPQTKAEIGSTRGRDAGTDEILELTGRRPQTIWIHEAALSLGYELDYLGRVRRSVESARADAEAVAAAHDTVKITVAAETARPMRRFALLASRSRSRSARSNIVSREADITAHRQRGRREFAVRCGEGSAARSPGTVQHSSLGGPASGGALSVGGLIGALPDDGTYRGEPMRRSAPSDGPRARRGRGHPAQEASRRTAGRPTDGIGDGSNWCGHGRLVPEDYPQSPVRNGDAGHQ